MSATVSSAASYAIGRLPGGSGGGVQYMDHQQIPALAIRPGQGLGHFYLGSSLHSVLAYLRSNPSQFPHIEIVYSKESPIYSPIIIKLESNGLRLHFDGCDQSLRLIEFLDWSLSTRASYKGTELGKGGVLTFKQIYSKIFGPTYPGWFDRDSSRYILSYPGVAFSFEVPESLSSEGIIKYLSGTSGNISSNNPRDGRGACLSMAIYKGHSWPEAQNQIFKPRILSVNHRGGNDIRVDADRAGSPESTTSTDNLPSTTTIDHLQIHHTEGRCIVMFSRHPTGINEYEIRLNSTTMQNIIMTLGPPSERIFKQDSRLSIHNPDGNAAEFQEEDIITNTRRKIASNSASRGNTDLFFNYFELGFDLCFDTSLPDPFVKKIIIHGNVPSSLSFQVYNRCRWLLFPPPTSPPTHDDNDNDNSPVSSETPFSKCYNLFIRKGSTDTPPLSMMLNRTIESPSSSVELVGHDEQTLSAADEEDWGSTQLYGCPRCIFEVLKNGTISSLTIF